MDVRTQRYFDRHAERFDSIYHDGQPLQRFLNRWLRKAIYERFAATFEHSEPLAGKSVLDIGCGSGRYAVEFAKRGAARVLGVDYAKGMLALAGEYAKAEGVADRCEFRDGDFTTVTMDEMFDVVIAIGVFDYQSNPREFMARMRDRTRPGGTVIASFPGRNLIRMPLRKFRYWLDDCPVLFYREEEVRALGAGFSKVEIIPITSSGTGFMFVGTK